MFYFFELEKYCTFGVFPAPISVQHVCLVLREAKRGHWIPRSCSYSLWKSSQCSQPLRHFSIPATVVLMTVLWILTIGGWEEEKRA